MANHKSAKKRSRQTVKKNQINSQILSKIKTNINNLYPKTFDALMRKCYMNKNSEPDIFDLNPSSISNKISWFIIILRINHASSL